MLAAGIDIGNSTTELMLADVSGAAIHPVSVRRAATAGRKGSPESVAAAARLLTEAEQREGRKADAIAVAQLHPVDTFATPVPLAQPSAQAIVRIDRGATPSGRGFAVGSHLRLDELAGPAMPEPVIVSVPRHRDFGEVARCLSLQIQNGWQVVGVVAAGDDAVLIGNRLTTQIPIADEASVDGIPSGARIALEVAPPGRGLEVLTDPLALAAALQIPPSRLREVAESVRSLLDLRAAAVMRADDPQSRSDLPALLEAADGDAIRAIALADIDVADQAIHVRPGTVRRLVLPSAAGEPSGSIADLHLVDLRQLADMMIAQRGLLHCDALVIATLAALPAASVVADLAALLGRPVRTLGAEAHVGRLGALTTPGVPSDATVCDIGAGTIDLIPAGTAAITAAGGGDLLTASVAALLGIPRQLAEYVKRAPSIRVLSPFLIEHENGERSFEREALSPAAIGRLCAILDTGPQAFDEQLPRVLSAQEWRAARLALKERAIGRNVGRCLSALVPAGGSGVLVLAGGGALDGEAGRMVSSALRARGGVVGRANVLGQYGPRYAVAAGLVRLLGDFEEAGL
jgi:hypothetical protein